MNPIQKIIEEQRKQSKLHKISEATINKTMANVEKGLQRRGIPLPEETKAKMSASHMGVAKPRTAEHSAKLSVAAKGRKSPNKDKPMSAETKAKLSATKTGVPQTEEHKAKIAASKKGTSLTEETKAKIGAANKGKPSPKKGLPKPKLTCPHCGQEGGNSQMKRYHFDNCKLKRD
jgi:hypothetical protein